MKSFVPFTKPIILIVSITSITYASKVLISQLCSIKQCAISLDAYFSEKTQQDLTRYLSDTGQSFSMNTIGKNIKDTFACVRKVDVFMLPSSIAHIGVKAHIPQYLVNENKVLTHEGMLISKEWFCPRVVDALYNLDIQWTDKKQTMLSQAGKCCVSSLVPQLLDGYHFVWEDETRAWLYDKEQPRFALLFDAQSVPDAAMIQKCNIIKQNLRDRGVFEQRGKKLWAADLRFAKQIIVFNRG
jgi:hypothetical protein